VCGSLRQACRDRPLSRIIGSELVDKIIWQRPPRPWELCEGGQALRVGGRRVRLADIVDHRTYEEIEPNITGHLMAVGLFFALGSVFVVPVIMTLVGPKFLIGAALFGGLGAAAIGEVLRRRPIRLWRVDIALASGETVTFAWASPDEVLALDEVLAGLG